MTSPDDIAHDPAGARRPDPDPTVLTTQALFREIGTLRELFEQRIAAMEEDRDRAIASEARHAKHFDRELALHRSAQRKLLDGRINGLASLTNERFASAERQRIEQKADTKAAVDAALSAAKEAVKEQTTASGLSISKSEAATTSQLKQQQETFTTAIDGLRRSIDELKDRAGEDARNLRQTISDVATTANGSVREKIGARDDRTAVYALITLLVAIAVVAVGVIGLVITRTH